MEKLNNLQETKAGDFTFWCEEHQEYGHSLQGALEETKLLLP